VNRRTLALAITLVLAGTFAFPSAASPLFAGPTDQLGDDVALAPSSDYAYLDADDELVVDLSPSNPDIDGEGVNADGRTTIGDVFRVRYNGSRYAHVWLTHGSDAVTFAVDGEPIQSEANNVTLAPNESVAVSLTVDTTGRVDGFVDDITIHSRVAEPATADGGTNEVAADTATETASVDGFATRVVAPTEDSRRFTALSAEPGASTEFDAGPLALLSGGNLTLDRLAVTSPERSYTVRATATDPGDAGAAVVDAGAEPLGAVRMTVAAGNVSAATMSFSAAPSFVADRGIETAHLAVYRYADGSLSELDVTATGDRDGRVTFDAETPGFATFVVALERPRLAVDDAALSAGTVAPGEPVSVTASVSNTGSRAGNRTVTVRVDSEIAAERTVEVAPGSTAEISVPVVRDEPGEYTVSVDGVETGSFTVAAADATATETTSATATTDSPTEPPVAEPGGFGLESLLGLVGLLAILAVVLVLARRTPRP